MHAHGIAASRYEASAVSQRHLRPEPWIARSLRMSLGGSGFSWYRVQSQRESRRLFRHSDGLAQASRKIATLPIAMLVGGLVVKVTDVSKILWSLVVSFPERRFPETSAEP